MKHLGDITKIDGAKVPVVDVVVGGSPCQDLSIAGKRAGLDGERSGLFMEQIRIIKEMRDEDKRNGRADVDIRPRYMVWENVPGSFSSNKGEDFRIVLEETAKVADENAVIPRPADGKWKTCGCIVGDGWSIAWRVLDAQFWGVPQRRRRIALVADFGGQSAGEILFVRKSVSGDSEQGKSKRKEATSNVARSIGTDDSKCYPLKIRGGCEGGGKGALIQTEKSATLSTLQDKTLFQAIGCDMYNQDLTGDKSATIGTNCGLSTGRQGVLEVYDARGNGDGKTVCTITGDHCNRVTDYTPVLAIDQGGGKSSCIVTEEKAPTLTTTHDGSPAVCYGINGDKAGTLDSSYYKGCGMRSGIERDVVAVCYWDGGQTAGTLTANNAGGQQRMPDKENFNCVIQEAKAVDCRNCTESDVNATLQSNMAHSLNGNNVVRVRYIVRRLTPLECERLQGFPDGWTDIGEWVDSNGKKRKTSDANRYKALGNSIALPSWKWLLKRLCSCYERDVTMASLFDGIGGFPYLWENLNGKVSCLWASEIEEFPIAVTKKRIGG